NQYMEDAVTRMGGLYPFIGKPGVFGEVSSTGQVSYSQNKDRALEIVKWANEVTELSITILKEMGAEKIDAKPIKTVTNYSLAHCAGTCRAGIDVGNSVVNPYFESHDIDNLFICDASAVPRQQQYGAMPTVAVASYAWRQIVDRHFS
ncbi:MAG: hypothetical protein HKN08_09340, partial [Gammaproteobacteria bacterium]|nr:hypothetical protein [Gammaproteobacteria bacterium]